ncbi:MAG: tRNA (cytosine(32)/uridine(32)-2'-O)-methyltransferase TrmJ [Gammaproteobacteria bacterium]|nr:tRNA (cytosine(32)/uridine(32)-2'-O)-methyltransferase TrmJ [Gammaproteobacteria bacterium]
MQETVDLSRIRVVLVNTSHPGNIGSVARAMKNMGLSKLYLVSPRHGLYHPHSLSRSSGADDLLDDAVIVDSLDAAVADCAFVVGASARLRSIPWPVFNPRECAEKVVNIAATDEVALVMGRENSGLTNEELERCNYLVHIPANPDYTSLNIAAATQVLVYEFRMAALQQVNAHTIKEKEEYRLANSTEMEQLYTHFETALSELGFWNPENPGKLMRRLRRLFNRTHLDTMELNILRGILGAAQGQKYKHLKEKK